MNNKPVAYVDPIWMDRPDLVMSHQLEIGKLFARTQFTNYVPLYTHPADTIPYKDLHQVVKNVLAHPVKELTDEEIGEMMGLDLAMHSSAYMDIVNKVRTVLRKAQEK